MRYELKMRGQVDEWTSGQGRGKTCFAPCSEINTGIACLDSSDEVEPRPNEENSTFSIQKSRRDDISG
jgi:hypothetical protein